MKLCVVLVLCVVLCAADRRRPDGVEHQRTQPRRHDDDERHEHHHRDDERRQHHRHDSERHQHHHHHDDNDDDDDDHEHHHGHEPNFSHLADADDSSWRHTHEHHRRGRPENRGQGWTQRNGGPGWSNERDGEDSRRDGQDGGQERRDRQKGGQERWNDRPDGRDARSRDQGHNRRDGDKYSGQRDRSGDDGRSFMKKNGKDGKKTRQTEKPPRSPEFADLTTGTDASQENDLLRVAGVNQPELTEHSLNLDRPSETDAPAATAAEQADALTLGWEDTHEAVDVIDPPPHQDVAAMARYIVHVSDWTSMATISTREPTRGMPFANVFSVCDGTRYRSTGIPYLYLTDMEISVKDLRVSNNASLTMSLAQTSFCQQRGYDPEDPLCAHVILSGQVLQVDEKDPEYVFARDALFSRHPEMSGWPASHNWFVAKLDIQNIIVLDYFGGAKTVTVKEYFATNPFKVNPRRENTV